MSDIPINPNGPVEPVVSTSGEGIAERYVEQELVESRASLNRTRIIGGLMSLFVLGYMGYLTSTFRANMEPKTAATIATGMANQRLDDLEPQFSSYIHEQVPEMIRKAPDEVISRLPEYRKNLEARVDSTLRAQADQGSAQLNKQLDDFLTAHKDEVGQLLKDGQDPANLERFGSELEASFKSFLDDTKIGDETIQQKLDSTLMTLRQVSARTDKLAKNAGLTPAEKSARHAIGMLMHRIKRAQAAEPNALPSITPEAVRESAENLKNSAMGTLDNARETVKSQVPAGMTTAPATPEDESASATPKAPVSKPMAAPAPKKP